MPLRAELGLSRSGSVVIAVDLGGTWIRAAFVARDGSHGEVTRMPTGRHRSAGEIVADIARCVEGTAAGAPRAPEAIAIGVPTVCDREGALLVNDNLPTMGGIRLREELARACGRPVTQANDAACFAIGEWRYGAAKGMRNLCGVTLGTGIGCGIVLEGRLHTGAHGLAGEIWKSPARDGTGDGTLEDSTCGRSISAVYSRATGFQLEATEIARRAVSGDEAAKETFRQFGDALGRGIAFLVNALDPEAVVFGGSVSLAFPLFLPSMAEALRRHTVAGSEVALLPSALGDWAALLGAAHLAFD